MVLRQKAQRRLRAARPLPVCSAVFRSGRDTRKAVGEAHRFDDVGAPEAAVLSILLFLKMNLTVVKAILPANIATGGGTNIHAVPSHGAVVEAK